MNNTPPLFHVRKLVCTYPGAGECSLSINELIIPAGKLVFLLGSSGSGKSTLLETLGMMNNTVSSGEIRFTPEASKPAIDLAALWKGNLESEITDIRKKHYSFIFQNTNLMDNFTAYENVCLSGMIKGDKVQQDVLASAKDLMHKVKLPENEVGLATLANNLSGGQRQRVAFVRAMNNDAAVIFGDEPTGNLDEANANELMTVIKSNLSENRTAIIVSHDINLALKHADIIVVITKQAGKGYGEVDINNIFERNSWEGKPEGEVLAFRKKLTDYFSVAADKTDMSSHEEADSVTSNLQRTYRKLFFNRESKILFGKKFSNLLILASIFFFTFLSIGFANGSLKYLNEKMNSAFVNWISISVPPAMANEDGLRKIRGKINNEGNKTEFNYSRVSEYHKNTEVFYDSIIKEGMPALYRTVDLTTDRQFLLEDILGKNVHLGRKQGFIDENDMAIIVSKKFLKDFGYPENAEYVWYQAFLPDPLDKDSMQKEFVPIPIRTIVNELPGKFYFLMPIRFFNALKNEIDSGPVFSSKAETRYISAFINSDDPTEKQAIQSDFEKAMSESGLQTADVTIEPDTFGYKSGYQLDFDFYPELPNYLALDSVWNVITQSTTTVKYKGRLLRTYSFDDAIMDDVDTAPDQFSVYFNDLKKVEEFAQFIERINDKDSRQQNNIEVDQTKVKEKKNFLFLSNVTMVISVLLILFATASIGLFIYNLVKTHLNKVKMNLGTFKAIGLSNHESIRIYFVIILVFVGITSTGGFVIAYGVGWGINQLLLHNVKSDAEMSYFVLMSINTLIAFVVVLCASLIISYRTIRRILSKSPGDLIYNR